VISKRNRRIIKFTKKGGRINNSVVCHVNDMISTHYHVNPKIEEHPDCVDIVVFSKATTILDAIESFVKKILFPYAQNSCNCNKCNIKKRPSFCTHKKAIT